MSIISALIWVKYWKFGIVPLAEISPSSIHDLVLAATILIEGLQIIGLGPDDNLWT